MSSLDLTRLAPADIVAALRSYPRRYRALFVPPGDDSGFDADELAERVGPDGRSALEIASDTARTWIILREALRQIVVADTPVVHPAVIDPSARDWETPPETLEVVLDQIDDGSTDLVESIERIDASQWDRTATAAGGASMTALDVVKEAVRVGHDNLVAAETTLRAVR